MTGHDDERRRLLLGLRAPAGPDPRVAPVPAYKRVDRSDQNPIKRWKRVAFGMTNWINYRTCALLYAGRPNWSLLNP